MQKESAFYFNIIHRREEDVKQKFIVKKYGILTALYPLVMQNIQPLEFGFLSVRETNRRF